VNEFQPAIGENEATGMVILRIASNIHDALKAGDQTEAEAQACWLVSALLAYKLADGIVMRLSEMLGLDSDVVYTALGAAASMGTGVEDE